MLVGQGLLHLVDALGLNVDAGVGVRQEWQARLARMRGIAVVCNAGAFIGDCCRQQQQA
jgi:hypothetical protein